MTIEELMFPSDDEETDAEASQRALSRFIPEPLGGPKGERKDAAIVRANRSEALRMSDFRTFVEELDKKNKQLAAMEEKLNEANQRAVDAERAVAFSRSAGAVKELDAALSRVRMELYNAKNVLERAR